MKKPDPIMSLIVISLLIIIAIMIYYNWFYLKNQDVQKSINNSSNNASLNDAKVQLSAQPKDKIQSNNLTTIRHNPYPKNLHKPVKLGKDDILVSFRIDDITFEKNQKPALENALYLARKYNITFDLAVIAQLFNQSADPEVFKIFEDNQDVFEIVAHGLTHANPVNKSSKGEFYDIFAKKPIPANIQEQHIKAMHDIFQKYNLDNYGVKIFLLPWYAGDNNTIKIANKYGYKLMTQTFVPNKQLEDNYIINNEYTLVSKDWVAIPMNQTLTNKDIKAYNNSLSNLIKKNQTRIQIVTHPINYINTNNSEELIKVFTNLRISNTKIKFSMISDRLSEIK